MMDYHIRKVKREDFNACAVLMSLLGANYIVDAMDSTQRGTFERYVGEQEKLGIVAECLRTNEVIGCFFLGLHPKLCTGYRQATGEGLAVATNHRRRGIATALIQFAIQELRTQGIRKMCLRTPKDWASNSLYDQMPGFDRRGSYFYYEIGSGTR